MKVALNEKNEWIILENNSPDGMYIDGIHKENLDMAKKVVKADWDMIFVYDGFEGVGKSVKMMQDAFYCDPSLTVAQITFNPEDFEKAIDNAKKFQAVCLDEAYGSLSSRGTMSQINRAIVQKLTVIRQKNLFIFIVLPTFFDLDKYVALWRSRASIHVYNMDNFQRGFFAFYNVDKKKDLYVKGKKFYDYKCGSPNYTGRFTNLYVVDEEEYRKKKADTSVYKDSTRIMLSNLGRQIRTEIAQNLKDKLYSNKQISEIMGVTTMTVHNYLNKYDQTGESLANEVI